MLERLAESRGLLPIIRVDNGPEFVGHELDAWWKERGVVLAYIQPGSPTQNAYAEHLDAWVFRTRDEVRQKTGGWQHDYDHYWPHKGLGYRPPVDALP